MNQESSFGGFVRQRRRELDLTQEELARRVGCAAITLRKIEADDLRASVQIAERLAMALAIPLEGRADFVRRARAVRPESAELPQVTPPPAMEEIGREDLTGRAIRGYALAERIGMGGMGSVYRAVQPNVEREVAVKIILPAFANHPDFIRRFEAEAQLVARLEHPHIVPLYDYWREPGVAYLVMRLLRGGNIQNILKQGALPIEITAHLLEQICSALTAAHRIGVVHRDLKPANVLLDEDNNAYLADFGIAKNLGDPDFENQTSVDAIIGSPQYMSPEQIRSSAVRPQTDIYCLGVMLYEMLTGALPFAGPTPFDMIQQHINMPMPPLSAHQAGLPAALDAVITRATAKDPEERYADALSVFHDFRQAIGTLRVADAHPVAISYEEEETWFEVVNPFKGLRAFSEADAENFFGRETLVQQLLARLGEGGELSRFLGVIGPSGSGKSSVVRAGLIPALRRGGLPGSENWFVVDMLPGKHPFEELEASLLRVAVNPPQSLLSQLKDGNRGLLRAVHRILPADETVELVLVIDQFEEIFTLVEDEAERALLLESIAAAVLDERSRLRVLITLRADFTDRPLRYVDFGEMLNRRFEFVLPLTADEVERAVAGPAQRLGLRLEKGLVSTIIREAGNQPGTLPLLQYALSELFEKREGRTLTNKAYQEIGGVLGALGRSAEAIYANLDKAGQTAARQLFLRLVTLGEGTEDTRRRVLREELEGLNASNGQLASVIDVFGRTRLLTFDHEPITRGATVEVAHEALLREWTRLSEWLRESRSDIRLQRQLAAMVSEWQNSDKDESFLLTGTRLEQFEGWSANTSVALTQDEKAYLNVSIAEHDRREVEEQSRQQRELENARKLAETERQRAEEQTYSANRLRIRNRVITTVGSIAVILALLAGMFGVQSSRNAEQAQNNFNRAEAQRLALEANRLLLSGGSSELIALLSLRSMNTHYTPEGDAALAAAARLDYPQQIFPHPFRIWDAAFSPDGRYILTGSDNGIIELWDALTGKEVREFIGPTENVVSVAYSQDGKYVFTGSLDGTARVWEVATGQQVRLISEQGVDYSPDGKYILTSGYDSTVRLWDVESGKELHQFSGYRSRFSPDSDSALIGDADGTLHLWDIQTGQEIRQFIGHNKPVSGIVFSSDGKFVLTAGQDYTARLWDVGMGEELQVFPHDNIVRGVAFSPDGKTVFTNGDYSETREWDLQTAQELRRFTSHANKVVVSPDGKYLLTSGRTGMRLWNIKSHLELPSFKNHIGFAAVAFSPDGKLVLTGGFDGIAILWDAVTGQKLQEFIGHTDEINYGAMFSPDGKHILTGSWDNTVRLWDIKTGEEVRQFTTRTSWVDSVAFSPDGKYIAASGGGGAQLWDASTGQELQQYDNGDPDFNIARVSFSPDGKYLVTADYTDATTQLWNLSTGELLRQFIGDTGALNSATFSPDGKTILTGSMDGIARLWDIETEEEIRHFIGHTEGIYTAVFSPDGKYVATASLDSTARLWDALTGQELRRFVGHTAAVENVAFSPDGKYLLTASDDGTARLWDVDYHDTMRYLCSRLMRDFTDDERAQYGIPDTTPTCPENQNSPSAP